MFNEGKKLKVLWPIVGSIAVLVVYVIVYSEWSAKHLLHDIAVLAHSFAVHVYDSISVRIHTSGSYFPGPMVTATPMKATLVRATHALSGEGPADHWKILHLALSYFKD